MAIVSEHEASASVNQPNEQGKGEESIIQLVRRLLDQSKLGTKEFRSQWPTNYKFVMGGRQWPIERPEWRFSEVVNTTWADIQTEVGIQTDARPKVDYVPAEASDIPFCNILKEVNDNNWQKYPWLQRVAENILDSKIYHVSHCEIRWNPELENGLGDVEHVILDPYGCYWDPKATCEDELRYFIYCEPVPTEKLKNDYPQFKDAIRPDVETVGYDAFGHSKSEPDVDRLGFSLSSGTRGRRPTPTNGRFGGEPMTLLVRCWLKDESVEELVNETDTLEGETKKEYILKKKYPYGRYVEFCNNTLLKDGDNGCWHEDKNIPYKHGMFPIVRFVNYSYAREYAGENEVTHKMGPAIVRNYIWSFMLDTMKQASNPKELFSSANREAAERSSNEPGQVLILPDFNGYERHAGEGIPSNLIAVLQEADKAADKVGGLQDVMRGAVDPAVTSGLLFDGYVEAAQVRPRLKNRNVDQSLQRMGKLDASLYLQFYTAPRTYRITNKEGWPEFVEFYIGEDGQARMTKTAPDMSGKYSPQPTQTMPVKGLPDIQIVSGSSIPFQKAQQYNRAKELFTMGAIDQQALLEEVDFPDKEEILQRMKEQAQMAAEAESAKQVR